MRAGALTAAALAVILAGCGGAEEPPPDNSELAERIENVSEIRPRPKQEAPGPSLIAITREDVAAMLESGAGCEFSEGGRLLFAATASGQGLARVNGLAERFTASGPVGQSGGFFVTERWSLSIGRLADQGPPVEQTTSWPARLVVTDRRRDDNRTLRLEGSWRCGA